MNKTIICLILLAIVMGYRAAFASESAVETYSCGGHTAYVGDEAVTLLAACGYGTHRMILVDGDFGFVDRIFYQPFGEPMRYVDIFRGQIVRIRTVK